MGPHHAETLREVAHETADEHLRPSFEAPPDEAKARSHLYSDSDDDSSDDDHDDHDPKQGGSHARMTQQDTLAVAQNGGVHDDSDDLDIDGDDLDDDDMTGGISSSPSIEDGMYPVRDPPPCWPRRVSSLRGASPSPSTHKTSKARSPVSPAVSLAATAQSPVGETGLSLADTTPQRAHHHHHHRDATPGNDSIEATDLTCATFEAGAGVPTKNELHDIANETTDMAAVSQTEYSFLEKRNELEHNCDAAGCDGELLMPYNPASDDDDDGSDLPLPDDPRYVDSG